MTDLHRTFFRVGAAALICIAALACEGGMPSLAQQRELRILRTSVEERSATDATRGYAVTAELALLASNLNTFDFPNQTTAVLRSPDGEYVTQLQPASDTPGSIAVVFDAGDNISGYAAVFEQMKTGIKQFAANRNSNIAVIAAADRPIDINRLQRFGDSEQKALDGLSTGGARSCVHTALHHAIDVLANAATPRLLLFISAGPDRCGQDQIAEIGRAAATAQIEIGGVGLIGTNAQMSDLKMLAAPSSAAQGLATMVDNANGGNLRDSLSNIVEGFKRRRTATWLLYPRNAGAQRSTVILQVNDEIIGQAPLLYDAPRALVEPTRVTVLGVQSTYDKVHVRLRLSGKERIRSIHVAVADASGTEKAAVTENTIRDQVTIDAKNLTAGQQYALAINVTDLGGALIAAAEAFKFSFQPAPSAASIESFSLPTIQRDALIITPTIDGEAVPTTWRIELVDANEQLVGGWKRTVPHAPILVVESPELPSDLRDEVHLRVQALDADGREIYGASAISDGAFRYQPPSALDRGSAWLGDDPSRILIAVAVAIILIVGVFAGFRILKTPKTETPDVTMGPLRAPYSQSDPLDKGVRPSYSGTAEKIIPCTVSALAQAAGGVAFKIGRSPFTLGRSSRCDGVIPSSVGKGVSSVHAVMEYIDGTWHIRDANSTYGTLVNSAKVGATLTPLSNGDELSLGPTFRMSYRIHEPTGTRAYTQVMPSTSGGTPRLRSTAGMPTDQLFQIRRQIEVLGRGNDASLRIPVDGSTGVSSRHASLERLPNGWQVRDLDSANGTFIDGQALPRGGSRTVEIGVRIGLGPQVTLVLEE